VTAGRSAAASLLAVASKGRQDGGMGQRKPWSNIAVAVSVVVLGVPRGLVAESFSNKTRDLAIPEPGQDLTAYRIDTDVFGWSRDFREMGAVGSEVRRGKQGEHRGEQFILIFDVGDVVPKENVQGMFVTQPALPDNPEPLDDIRDSMWIADIQYQKQWPKRPIRKHFPGAMLIEPMWEAEEVEEGVCQPVVGFFLTYRKEVRYQPHLALRLKAPCSELRLTDTRTYWAKKDLGAVMMRFDYAPDAHEMSIRFPLSAAWHLAKPLKIVLRGDAKAPALVAARTTLAKSGTVTLENTATPGPLELAVRPGLNYLGHRLSKALGIPLVTAPLPPGVDLLLAAGLALSEAPAAKGPAEVPSPVCGGLLKDCR